MSQQVDEARERVLAFRSHPKFPHTGRHYTEFQESMDMSILASAYLELTKGEWLEAADSEGWWWHEDGSLPEGEIVKVWRHKYEKRLLYRYLNKTIPASGGKWQRVIGPFGVDRKGDQ